jgi:hypothetical protein
VGQQGLQNTDMGEAACSASTERESDRRPLAGLRTGLSAGLESAISFARLAPQSLQQQR